MVVAPPDGTRRGGPLTMRILLTGPHGMLGHELWPALKAAGCDVIPAGREEMDITDWEMVRDFVGDIHPDLIVHAAAFTNVDGAEADPHTALAVNGQGTHYLSLTAGERAIPLVYVSTDYVFNGHGHTPYPEDHPASPLGVYGQSKWQGECHVREHVKDHLIVRTSWLYGHGGKNFVDTMLRLAESQAEVRVVADQVGSPTWTRDLSRAIVELIAKKATGTVHGTGDGFNSWAGFAEEIFRQKGLPTRVIPITTEELNRPAPRPKYSVLSHRRLNEYGVIMLPWKDALKGYLET